MRTTIEMRDEHRAALLEIAARRGVKGLSPLVAEAIDEYLRSASVRESRRKLSVQLRGALSGAEARRLREETSAIRKSWR
jgi:hypothetical protein